jgi:hypothetical protein
VLHPVGDLPAAVYWRRRVLVLTLAAGVLGGGGWLVASLPGGDGGPAASAAPATSTGAASSGTASSGTASPGTASPGTAAPGTPALEQIAPSLAGVRTPVPAPTTTTSAPAPSPTPTTAAAPSPGGPCTDDVLDVAVRGPGSASAASKPTFELVVTNTAAVPCVRALDKGLQEIVLLDGGGGRVWGSNDCFPEAGSDTRTLQPGEQVSFPVQWGGLTSSPGCAAPRTRPPAGTYVLRGRLDTKASGDTPLTLT